MYIYIYGVEITPVSTLCHGHYISETTEKMADHFAPAVDPMHGRSAEERSSFLAMLKKGNESHREVTDKYVGFWDEKECGERKDNYMSLVNR